MMACGSTKLGLFLLAVLAAQLASPSRMQAQDGAAGPGPGSSAGCGTNRSDRLKLDPAKVLALQMQALGENGNSFDGNSESVSKLDLAHKNIFCWMDNVVRRFDARWQKEGPDYEYQLSSFRLSSLVRVGGRSDEDEYDVRVKFRAKLALPSLERNLYLFVNNSAVNALPGEDPLKQETQTQIGLQTMRKFMRNSHLVLGGGARWRSSGPVAYADLEWRIQREMAGGDMRLTPRLFYYTDDGLGQITTMALTCPIGQRKKAQFVLAERSSESTDGLEFEQTLRFAWFHSGTGRGWVAQASIFPHHKSSEWYWDNSLVNLTWRDALYRNWIYYTITPQVEFPQEDDYRAKPSLRVGFEILFGGKIPDLL